MALSDGDIALIVCGCVCALAIGALLFYLFWFKNKEKQGLRLPAGPAPKYAHRDHYPPPPSSLSSDPNDAKPLSTPRPNQSLSYGDQKQPLRDRREQDSSYDESPMLGVAFSGRMDEEDEEIPLNNSNDSTDVKTQKLLQESSSESFHQRPSPEPYDTQSQIMTTTDNHPRNIWRDYIFKTSFKEHGNDENVLYQRPPPGYQFHSSSS